MNTEDVPFYLSQQVPALAPVILGAVDHLKRTYGEDAPISDHVLGTVLTPLVSRMLRSDDPRDRSTLYSFLLHSTSYWMTLTRTWWTWCLSPFLSIWLRIEETGSGLEPIWGSGFERKPILLRAGSPKALEQSLTSGVLSDKVSAVITFPADDQNGAKVRIVLKPPK